MASRRDEAKALRRLAKATKRVVGMDHETWANCDNEPGYKAYIASSGNGIHYDGIMTNSFETPDMAVDAALRQLAEQEASA